MAEGTPWWIQGIYAVLVPLAVTMLLATIQQRRQLKAAAPRDEAETTAVLSGIQTNELKRMADETKRMAERMQELEDKADKADEKADRAQELAREQGDRINVLERKQRSAVQFIGYLISQWPSDRVIPVIPDDLVEDVGPHIKRPKWAAPAQETSEGPAE